MSASIMSSCLVTSLIKISFSTPCEDTIFFKQNCSLALTSADEIKPADVGVGKNPDDKCKKNTSSCRNVSFNKRFHK